MEQFYHLFILFGVLVLFKVGLLPIYRQGGNRSWNTLFYAVTASNETLERTGNNKEGVDAQERSEAVWRLLVPGFLLSWMPFVGIHWGFWLLASGLGSVVLVKGFRRQFDGMGHTVEIVTVDTVEYERREILSMKRQRHFAGMTTEQIYNFVERRKPLARLWRRIAF